MIKLEESRVLDGLASHKKEMTLIISERLFCLKQALEIWKATKKRDKEKVFENLVAYPFERLTEKDWQNILMIFLSSKKKSVYHDIKDKRKWKAYFKKNAYPYLEIINFLDAIKLDKILNSKPNGLVKIDDEINLFIQRNGFNRTHTKRGTKAKFYDANLEKMIGMIFNYNHFSSKNTDYYSGYELTAKLDIRTCLYCNRNFIETISRPSKIVRPDLDHFFPKSHFPFLAVSFYNLIPSCKVCNSGFKGANTIDLLHPYLDGFGDNAKFITRPKDTGSIVGLKSNFSIEFSEAKGINKDKIENSINEFGLDKLYQFNKDVAISIRRKAAANKNYLKVLYKTFKDKNGNYLFKSKAELFDIAFGNYLDEENFEKRPLAKFTRDIAEDAELLNFPDELL